jgi:hypothetical protein
MKNFIFFYFLIKIFLFNSCTPEPGLRYEIENKTELSIKIEAFVISGAAGSKKYEMNPKSKIRLKIDEGRALGGTDSLVVIFSDGKMKTDILYDYRTDLINFYNPARQKQSSCGRNCSRTTYVIDEQDYAEAK